MVCVRRQANAGVFFILVSGDVWRRCHHERLAVTRLMLGKRSVRAVVPSRRFIGHFRILFENRQVAFSDLKRKNDMISVRLVARPFVLVCFLFLNCSVCFTNTPRTQASVLVWRVFINILSSSLTTVVHHVFVWRCR